MYVASILVATEAGTHPERRTSLIVPAGFDLEAFETDPRPGFGDARPWFSDA